MGRQDQAYATYLAVMVSTEGARTLEIVTGGISKLKGYRLVPPPSATLDFVNSRQDDFGLRGKAGIETRISGSPVFCHSTTPRVHSEVLSRALVAGLEPTFAAPHLRHAVR